MARLKRIDIEKLQELLADAPKRAGEGERIILHRGGRAVAALVPWEDAKFMERYEDEFWSRAADEALEEMKRTGEKPIPLEQIVRELDEQRKRHRRKAVG